MLNNNMSSDLHHVLLDKIDKEILNIIQAGFPLCPRPYLQIASSLNITEYDAFSRVKNLRDNKIIRRLGANFDSSKLGFHSTLCAAKVPEYKKTEFIMVVNSYKNVTHNYLRKNAYNVWFTVIAESREKIAEILFDITEKTGIRILNLPASKLFKIKVDFAMDTKNN